MDTLTKTGIFLIQILFDLYISLLLLRAVLQFFKADYYNPISQFVVKLTDPLLLPLRRIIPRFRYVDLSILILVILVDLIKFFILLSLSGIVTPGFLTLTLLVIYDLIKQLINIFFYAIILVVIMSWLSPSSHHPVMNVLYKITEPLLAPVRRVIPPIAGFDISPIFVLIGLKLLTILLVLPLAGLLD